VVTVTPTVSVTPSRVTTNTTTTTSTNSAAAPSRISLNDIPAASSSKPKSKGNDLQVGCRLHSVGWAASRLRFYVNEVRMSRGKLLHVKRVPFT